MKLLNFILLILILGCSQNPGHTKIYSWSNGYSGGVLKLQTSGKFTITRISDAKISGYKSFYPGFYANSDSLLKFHITQFVEKTDNQKMNGFSGKRVTTMNKFPNNFIRFDSTLYKIEWGSRIYLIKRSDLFDFISDINSKIEPRVGEYQRYFVNQKKLDSKPYGLPHIPTNYQNLMDTSLVKGVITKILTDTTVTIRFEKGAKLHPGFMYWNRLLGFKLLTVEHQMATALVYLDDGLFPDYSDQSPYHINTRRLGSGKVQDLSIGDTVLNRTAR